MRPLKLILVGIRSDMPHLARIVADGIADGAGPLVCVVELAGDKASERMRSEGGLVVHVVTRADPVFEWDYSPQDFILHDAEGLEVMQALAEKKGCELRNEHYEH